MNKILLLIGLALTLTACGSTDTEVTTETTTEAVETEVTEEVTEATEEVTETEEVIEAEANLNTYEGDYGIYEFTDEPVIVDDIYGEDKKIMIIPISYTNTTEEPQDPWVSWVIDIEATQSDENQTYTLNGGMGMIPEEYEEPMNAETNPDATVEYNIPLELVNDSPVVLKDFINGNVIKEIPVQ